jgi:hypothetical protein
MEVAVSLENSVRIEIHRDAIVDLDFFIEVGSRSVSWDDLSIRDCTCWKRDRIYVGVVC